MRQQSDREAFAASDPLRYLSRNGNIHVVHSFACPPPFPCRRMGATMATARFSAAKGTHDIFPVLPERPEAGGKDWWVSDIAKWHWLEGIARDLCQTYGYKEVRTPAFEVTDLFRRAVGEGTDIVSKEMYDVTTERGSDKFTLRPEGTAPTLRTYVEHRMDLDRPVTKVFYIASIFRHETEQRGRYRQHHQFGIEALGAQGPDIDAEVISLAMQYFRALGVARLTLKLNSVGTIESRAKYVEALRAYSAPFLSEMSEDNKRRYEQNALRMLDSKSARDQELLADAPLLTDYLDLESQAHFEKLKEHLTALGISYELDPRLVRGFDYYTRTAFEVQSPDVGAQSALAGGGRYDKLVEYLGGQPTPGIGFGSGIERVLIALQSAGVPVPDAPGIAAFLAPLGASARAACVPLLAQLREAGIAADMDYTGRKMKVMLEQADKLRARYAVILGDNELAEGVAQIREIATTSQQTVRLDELATFLKG
jgi:histidyl-tRNA synthetase